MRPLLSIALGLTLVAGVQGQPTTLTSDEITEAIRVGSRRLAEDIGTRLREANPWSVWYEMDFGLTIHTPVTWLQYLASRAASDGHPLKADDVTEDARTKFLRVFVRPTAYVRLLTLQPPNGRTPLRPTESTACTEYVTFASRVATATDNTCTEHLFDWTAVLNLTDSGRKEFEVSVTAVVPMRSVFWQPETPQEIKKQFRIKREHLARLKW